MLVNNNPDTPSLPNSSHHGLLQLSVSDVRESFIEDTFQELKTRHDDDPIRHYHTFIHLIEMMCYIDRYIASVSAEDTGDHPAEKQTSLDRAVLILSIMFHDAIYDPMSSTNEEDSALLYQKFFADLITFIPQQFNPANKSSNTAANRFSARVNTYILATKTHIPPTNYQNDKVLQLFLDADMSVLAKQPHSYDVYAGLIRCEYQQVPREIYCEKRAEILQSFLNNTEKVFGLEQMRGLEGWARTNLKREIDCLKRGVIPGEIVD